jgi:hypothetical protein
VLIAGRWLGVRGAVEAGAVNEPGAGIVPH